MKTKFTSLVALMILLASSSELNAQFSISIVSSSNLNTITCATPSIVLNGTSNYTQAPVIYLWNTPSGLVTGASLTVTQPGGYTLAATAGTLSASQVISIGINTTAPASLVTPTIQTITCNPSSVSGVTLVAVSPTANITQKVIAPSGGPYLAPTYTTVYSPGGNGTYTYVLTDNANGCFATKTFSVNSGSGFPTAVMASSQNYSLGCNSRSLTTISVPSATASSPGGSLSYTLLAPGNSTALPSPPFGMASSFSVTAPGTYTMIIRDISVPCDLRVPVSITQNTIAPSGYAFAMPPLLTCNTPSIVLQAAPANSLNTYSWTSAPGGVPTSSLGSSITVGAVFTAPTNTFLATYSLGVIDNNNKCRADTTLNVYQNIFPPHAGISSSASVITCAAPTVTLFNVSVTGIPAGTAFSGTLPVTAMSWMGPAPQLPGTLTSTYAASTPGVYTLNVKDQNNGCTSATVITIGDAGIYPVVGDPGPFTVLCPDGTVQIMPTLPASTTNLSFSWACPPTAITGGTTGPSLVTNQAGTYTLTVTDNSTGCSKKVQLSVWACVGLNEQGASENLLSVAPNPGTGLFQLSFRGDRQPALLKIYNTVGQLLRTQNVNKTVTTLDLGDLPDGVYVICAYAKDGTMGRTRLVKAQ